MTSLPDELRSELSAGEQPLWWGRPRQGLVLRRSDVFAIPFSLLWCGGTVLWEYSVASKDAPPIFVLWGLPFIAVGLYLVVGRFFVDAKQRESTYYAVTAERVLIVSGLFTRKVQSLNLRTLSQVTLIGRPSGEGTIAFGPMNPWASILITTDWAGARRQSSPHFDLIADAASVRELISGARKKARDA